MDPRLLKQSDVTHMYMIKIVHKQLVILKVSAKIQHENSPVLNCYEEFYKEYCQLVTGVAYTISIYVTFHCYIVIQLVINNA